MEAKKNKRHLMISGRNRRKEEVRGEKDKGN